DRSPEVADSLGQVALVDVVGTDADFYQFVHQLLHYMGAIVDARQNHRLVPQGDAGIGQHFTGPLGLGGDFLRMVEMGVQPDRMILPQDPAQVLRDPLGKHHRSPGSDPDNFHMGNFPEVFQQVFQDLVVDQQPVSARSE